MVPLKYLSNFGGTLEMPLINCKMNFTLTWSANCVMCNTAANQATTFAITDTKRYVPVVTLSTQDKVYKSIIKIKKYKSIIKMNLNLMVFIQEIIYLK